VAARADAPDLIETLAAYETWVDARIPTLAPARADKHARMAADPFAFLRAGYARWVQRMAALGADAPGPILLAVGDLHVENFGTWRDVEGRLVWGVNDLDEADRLPAAHDLVRLAVSALLAERQGAARFPRAVIVDAMVDGYAESAAAGGHPIVLDRPAPEPLGPLLPSGRAARWWAGLLALPAAQELSPPARDLLLAELPDGAGPADLRARVAGMGSRDHLRVVAIAPVAGAPVVREIKALGPPATRWLSPSDRSDGAAPQGAELLHRAGPSADPALRIIDGWVLRRLAPWSDRIELHELHRRVDAVRLVRAMGAETANLHLGSSTPQELAALATPAARRWIRTTSKKMLEDTVMDWLAWRDAHARAAQGVR
jgi:hypothetical protein